MPVRSKRFDSLWHMRSGVSTIVSKIAGTPALLPCHGAGCRPTTPAPASAASPCPPPRRAPGVGRSPCPPPRRPQRRPTPPAPSVGRLPRNVAPAPLFAHPPRALRSARNPQADLWCSRDGDSAWDGNPCRHPPRRPTPPATSRQHHFSHTHPAPPAHHGTHGPKCGAPATGTARGTAAWGSAASAREPPSVGWEPAASAGDPAPWPHRRPPPPRTTRERP